MDSHRRRKFLLTSGAVIAGLSGCLGTSSDEGSSPEETGTESQTDNSEEETTTHSENVENGQEGDETESEENAQPIELPRKLEWEGQGEEHISQECSDAAYWKWVLTPGGSNPIEEARLTVSFEDGEVIEHIEGERPGQGQGSMHFDAVRPSGTVEDAFVSFSGGGRNPMLTLSGSGCVPNGDYTPEVVYWQVDFGPGEEPPDPPVYAGNDLDLMAALGNSEEGVTENPSAGPWQGHGQFADIDIVDDSFRFDDEAEPTEVTVEFEIEEDAPPRDVHLVTFILPGPFQLSEIELQERASLVNGTFEGGDHIELTTTIPQPDPPWT